MLQGIDSRDYGGWQVLRSVVGKLDPQGADSVNSSVNWLKTEEAPIFQFESKDRKRMMS